MHRCTTRLNRWLNVLVITALLAAQRALPAVAAPAQRDAAVPATADAKVEARVKANMTTVPLMFIENVGQFAPEARFQLWRGNSAVWLTDNALWLERTFRVVGGSRVEHSGGPPSELTGETRHVVVKISFSGANPHPRLEPFGRREAGVSYFIGDDPAKWRTDVPAWGGVRYVGLYPELDLELSDTGGEWVWRLVVHEGAGPDALAKVRLRLEGAKAALEGGQLLLKTGSAEVALPLLEVEGANVAEVFSPPQVIGDEVRHPFSPPAGPQPKAEAQGVIGPIYSTFLGGSDEEWGVDIAVDGSGAAYVTGYTESSDFPTTAGAYDDSYNGFCDAFVAKLNAAGDSLVYSTFLGGSISTDLGIGIAVDGSGAAYVVGQTWSSDFPTHNAYDSTQNGSGDVFVTKLSATGDSLVYSTFLGGSSWDFGSAIAVDGGGAAYVVGETSSPDFPTHNAYDSTYNGSEDVFVTKLSAAGDSLAYSTFLGGSDNEACGLGMAVDGSGSAYVTGETRSANFPANAAYDDTYNGNGDAFVTKLSAAGDSLVYSTFLGASNEDWSQGVAVDGSDAAYVTGFTESPDFPTLGAYDGTFNGLHDAFVTKLSAAGDSLVYSTFLGGSGWDHGIDIAVDGSGAAYVTGSTDSSDLPTHNAWYSTYSGSGDGFVAKLNTTGNALLYSTFLGASNEDCSLAVAVDGRGAAYVTGFTRSSNFPIVNAYDSTHNGDFDTFVAKLDILPPAGGGGGDEDDDDDDQPPLTPTPIPPPQAREFNCWPWLVIVPPTIASKVGSFCLPSLGEPLVAASSAGPYRYLGHSTDVVVKNAAGEPVTVFAAMPLKVCFRYLQPELDAVGGDPANFLIQTLRDGEWEALDTRPDPTLSHPGVCAPVDHLTLFALFARDEAVPATPVTTAAPAEAGPTPTPEAEMIYPTRLPETGMLPAKLWTRALGVVLFGMLLLALGAGARVMRQQ